MFNYDCQPIYPLYIPVENHMPIKCTIICCCIFYTCISVYKTVTNCSPEVIMTYNCNIFNYIYAPNFVRTAGEYHITTMLCCRICYTCISVYKTVTKCSPEVIMTYNCNIFNYLFAPNFACTAGEYHITTMFTSCAHKWGQYTPALITTHLIQKYPIKIFILQSCATQVGIFRKKMYE